MGDGAMLRLAHALGTSEQFWVGLQADYDLEQVRKSSAKVLQKVKNVAAGQRRDCMAEQAGLAIRHHGLIASSRGSVER